MESRQRIAMHATRCTTLFLVAAALGLAAANAGATGISRCTGPDGAAVYTDANCASLGAQDAPMPTTLLRSLARDASDATGTARPAVELGELRPLAGSADGRRPRTYAGCPRTPQELDAAFQESVASGDVNELAAIYDWTDVSGRQSRELLRRLEQMSRSRAQDVSYNASGFRRRSGCLLLTL
jgi:hypothetical protein